MFLNLRTFKDEKNIILLFIFLFKAKLLLAYQGYFNSVFNNNLCGVNL